MHAAVPLRAVVIGAGLAGLTAAHCLADGLFDEVTLLKRDSVDASNDAIKPQVAQFAAFEKRHCRAADAAAA
jgi:glycine/D-amino acid oxidase-like deaminating enzyme